MKLLDKKTIAVEKSSERKKEVEEGIKLAKSVDSLRETHAKEQINLKKFRDNTLASTKSELDVLLTQRDAILNDIVSLEQRRKEASAPIDLTNEWKQVEKSKQDILQRETNVINREILVQNVEERERKLVEKEIEAQEYFNQARMTYTKTEDIRTEIENRKRETEEFVKNRLLQLDVQEKDLASREFVVSQQKEQIEKDKNIILIKGTELIERESNVESQVKSLFEQSELIRGLETLTKQYNAEAAINYDKSENMKFEMNKLKEEADKDIHDRYIKLSSREKEVGYRERDLTLEREKVENDKKEIEKEKIHIASQQETLRQAWNNIKNLQSK